MSLETLRVVPLPNPRDLPPHVIFCNTRGRWGTSDKPGAANQMISSAQNVMNTDQSLKNDYYMLIADGSDNLPTLRVREELMRRFESFVPEPAPIFFLTPDLQAELVDKVVKKTGLPEKIVRKVLYDQEYDSNRTRIDATLAAMVLASGRAIKGLGFDDDIVVSPFIKTVKKEVLEDKGLEPKPNSYVFWVGEPLPEEAFDTTPNSLRGYFEPLGKTVAELLETMPDLVLSGGWTDEMHDKMSEVSDKPVMFQVAHHPQRIRPEEEFPLVTFQAVTTTKTRLPDPRTVKYVEQLLSNDLIPPEGTIFSYLAGPLKPFAYYKAGFADRISNVDSANMSWLLNPETVYFLRWFPSSPKISAKPKRGMVDGQYRSDNEWLTMYLVTIWKKMHRRYAYLTGIQTLVEHYRAQTGYRPKDPAEQAASSLVGHEMAEAALSLLEFYPDGRSYLNLSPGEKYEVPMQNAQKVFGQMRGLREICDRKIRSLRGESAHTYDPVLTHILQVKLQRYIDIGKSIDRRISGRSFDKFWKRLNEELNEQLPFTNEVLVAYPKIIEALAEIIMRGELQVLQYAPPKERADFSRRGVVYKR